jgi:hypothetical protein
LLLLFANCGVFFVWFLVVVACSWQVFFWHTDSQGLEALCSASAGSGGASFDGGGGLGGGFDAGVAPSLRGLSGAGGSKSSSSSSSSSSSGGSSSSLVSGGGPGLGHLPPLAAAAHVQLRYYTQVGNRRV